jgi:hypothetical protein
MSTMQFTQPATGGNFLRPADHNGHLILVTAVHEAFERYDDLASKDKLNVRFDYVDLDGDQQLVEDALSSHPGIALRLKAAVGKDAPVLGRIGQEPSKKAGFNPTWVLGPYTEGVDDVTAGNWMTNRATASVSQPPAAAPTPAPVAPAPVQAAAAPVNVVTQAMHDLMTTNNLPIPEGTQIVG